MRVYGLTGGISSGKSLVAYMLKELGAGIVDADTLARDVVSTGSDALKEIEVFFGGTFLNPDGSLNRKKLGAHVFSDKDALTALNKITHPRIAAASQKALQKQEEQGYAITIYEAALLVENNLYQNMQALIVVYLPQDLQVSRLQKRDSLDIRAAKQRIDSQASLHDKLEVADYIIDNSGTEQETKQQVAALWQYIRTNDDQEKNLG